jgi:hypothetical protein
MKRHISSCAAPRAVGLQRVPVAVGSVMCSLHRAFFARMVFIGFLLLTIGGCEMAADYLCENTELSRISSPDQQFEAVLTRTSCGGATTSYVYRVTIVPRGKKTRRSDTVFLSEKLEGEKIVWLSSTAVQIRYAGADVKDSRKSWRNKNTIIEVYQKQEP